MTQFFVFKVDAQKWADSQRLKGLNPVTARGRLHKVWGWFVG